MSSNQAWLRSLALAGAVLLGCTESGADGPITSQQEEQVSTQSSGLTAQAKQATVSESKRAFLLAQQAREHASRRDYAGALSKLEAAIAVGDDVPEYLMLRCMLRERVSNQPQLDCYANVVRAYEKEGASCESNLNCVVAAAMASLPEAQEYRSRYLEAPKSATDQELTETVLKGFTRDGYLHSILP